MSKRGSSAARGYGAAHRRRRRMLAPLVEAGHMECARCGLPIEPGAPWDLGHVDGDKTRYQGPEHQRCSRQTEWHGVKKPKTLKWSRVWYLPIPANVELVGSTDPPPDSPGWHIFKPGRGF